VAVLLNFLQAVMLQIIDEVVEAVVLNGVMVVMVLQVL
jgi:hypothetical protein